MSDTDTADNDRCPYCGTDRESLDDYEGHVLGCSPFG